MPLSHCSFFGELFERSYFFSRKHFFAINEIIWLSLLWQTRVFTHATPIYEKNLESTIMKLLIEVNFVVIFVK